MLDINTVTTAADLAAVLTTQGIQLAPKGGMPLSKLNQTLLGAGMGLLTGLTKEVDGKSELDPSFTAMLVAHSHTCLPDGSPSEYMAVMAMLADEISHSVTGTISFSRNVVNPIIKDICDKIINALDEAGRGGTIARNAGGQRFAMSNGSLVVNILEEGPDSIYLDDVTDGEVSTRQKLPYQNLISPVFFPELTSAQLFEYFEANAESQFQRDVLDEIRNREDGYQLLLDTYNNTYRFFPGRPTGTDIRRLTNDLSITPLIILALGTALAQEFPEGTQGSANTVTETTAKWVNQVKNIIAINIEVYKESLADKSIVLSSNTENFEVNMYVNKENYNSYLEDGGSTEALLGASFSDKDYDYDNLLTNQDKYEQAYERRVADAAAFNEANRLTIFKNTLRSEIYDQIFNCDEDAIRPVIPAEARQSLDEHMKKIFVDALDNPHQTVRHVVCNTLFTGTDAEEILVNIDNVCDKNDNLTVRDASALVVLDYLTKYLVAQMDVKRTF